MFSFPFPSMNPVCCIHGPSEASGGQRCILCWKCQALKPGLILAWAWAGFVQSLPQQLLFPGRCWGCCKTLLREEDLLEPFPVPGAPSCP